MSFENPSANTAETKKVYSPEEIKALQERVKGEMDIIYLGLRAGLVNRSSMGGRGQFGEEPITAGTWYQVGNGSESIRFSLKAPEREGKRAKPSMIEVSRAIPAAGYFIDANDGKVKPVGLGEIQAGMVVGQKEFLVIKDDGEASFSVSEVTTSEPGNNFAYKQVESAQVDSDPDKTKDAERVLKEIGRVSNTAQHEPELKISQHGVF